MEFIADLHVHSRFSLATSPNLAPRVLAAWAARKGIDVIGTGDFTHPQWLAELRENLAFDEESGLYKIKNINGEEEKPVLFCPQCEISCVYRKGGKTRKVHNVIFAPSLEVAEKIGFRLARVGKVTGDGRPILKLDSRDLFELVLECSDEVELIPAHIWTPWYSLFGAKSGFDKIEDCYGDLTPRIFALEMGLSSNPAMNRRVSALDGYALVANSDAHSGANLGREANVFRGTPSYKNIFSALKFAASRQAENYSPCRFAGTIGFYPEAGKYHYDGHRVCGVCLRPEESAALGDTCPECGKPLTLGALRRVYELADRDEPVYGHDEPESFALTPLMEIFARVYGVGAGSRKVARAYDQSLAALGEELPLLRSKSIDEIRAYDETLAEAIGRIRAGNVRLIPGFDGQFGEVEIFNAGELAKIRERQAKKCLK